MMARMLFDKGIWLGPALLALLLLSLATSSAVHGQAGPEDVSGPVLLPEIRAHGRGQGNPDNEFAPGQIAVGVRRDVVGAAALAGEIEASVIETMSLKGLDGADGDAGVDGYLMRVPVGEEWTTIDRLLEDPAVAFAQPNWIVRAAGAADDVAAAETAFDVNDPLYADGQWYMQRILASRAWALSGRVEPAGADALPIRVAVIDSGVDHTHEDIRGNLSLTGINYFDPSLSAR